MLQLAVLWCHKLMDKLVTSDFQGRPSSKVLNPVPFQAPFTWKDIEGLTTTVRSLKTEVKGMQVTQQKLKTKADTD
jgi:hypothetical protein